MYAIRSYYVRRKRYSGLIRDLTQASDEFRRTGRELVKETGPADFGQGRETRSHRQRIAGQGTGLVDRAVRREPGHDVRTAAETGSRQAAANDLARITSYNVCYTKLLRIMSSKSNEIFG